MACGGCRNGQGTRHGAGDLSKFAFLSPRQLRLLKEQQAALDSDKEVTPPTIEGEG